jgi:hypothetical protein
MGVGVGVGVDVGVGVRVWVGVGVGANGRPAGSEQEMSARTTTIEARELRSRRRGMGAIIREGTGSVNQTSLTAAAIRCIMEATIGRNS